MFQIKKMRADHVVDFSAEELKKYLRMMMPETPEIEIIYEPGAKDGFRLGLMEDFGLDMSEAADPVLDDILHIDTDEKGGIIAGSNPRSILMAVYRFFRENGCRWLYPGIDGEYIPMKDIEPVKYHKMADQRFRGVCNEGAESQQCMMETIDFNPKVGMNVYMIEFDNPYTYYNNYYSHRGNEMNRAPERVSFDQVKQWKRLCEVEMSKRGLQFHDMGHGWTADPYGFDSTEGWAVTTQEIPEESRQHLALLNGVREFRGGVPLNTNLCMSNPLTRTIMAKAIADYAEKHQNVDFLHVWLADGSCNHCECDECRKMIPTDYYMMIMNELDEMLTARNLATRIVFICYVDTLWGPEKIFIKNPKRFSLLYAPITRTYTTSMNGESKIPAAPKYVRNAWERPVSGEENIALLRTWKENWKGPCFSYEYHFWLHQYRDPGAMYFSRRIYDDIRGLKALGIDGYVEDGSQRSFFPNGLNMYTYAMALFDNDLSYEEIVEDFMSHAYGTDWKKVADYMQKISDTFDFAYVSGEKSMDLSISKHYNPAMAEQLKKVDALAEEGLALVKAHTTYACRPEAISYRMLRFHTEYCKGLAKALIALAQGKNEEASKLFLEFLTNAGRHEIEFDAYYDQRTLFHSFKKFMNIDTKSLIEGE